MRSSEYAELKRLVETRGLFDRQPAYYAGKMVQNLAMLVAGLLCLALVEGFGLQLANAGFLALVFTQVAFISHDSGHYQICRSARRNELICLLHSNLLLGMSGGWWIRKHNQHHVHPNVIDLDPDLDLPSMAGSVELARRKKGFWRFVMNYQAYFFLPSLLMMSWALRVQSIQAVRRKTVQRPRLEAFLMIAHLVIYLGVPVYFLGPVKTAALVFVHQALFGLFLASVFSPNHKGMPLLMPEERMDFLRQQVLTARNIRPSLLKDWWFGALNYQIEHHLFPTIPRNRMGEVSEIVRDFCRERSIEYCETGMIESYRGILRHLHRISGELRDQSRPMERSYRGDTESATGVSE